ncbi:MAG: enoyl-CoA hydratase/isomerase family protein [Planctomycetota bacterium]
MSEKLVKYEAREGIAILTLDDAPLNAYTHEMMVDLDAAILRARMDDSVHVIVLTGAGEKFFCVGANISMLVNATPSFKYYFCLHANETLNRLEQTPKLVIAAINGHCVGGGLEVALACDLRVARRGGGKCGLPEVALGVLPGTGGTQRAVRLLGKSRALRLMTDGGTFDFERAHELGLVDELVDEHEDFLESVLAFAGRYLPPNKAPRAVGLIKRACQSGAEMAFEQGLALERELQQQLFTSMDAREGLLAYDQKRAPRFKGE